MTNATFLQLAKEAGFSESQTLLLLDKFQEHKAVEDAEKIKLRLFMIISGAFATACLMLLGL